ncbi:hypothetical protein [Mariprofundus ferrooxydans]|uniref:hypothetical protein n=1 Tax=Mariprofundus ferrooxydans TaxID=314344 RepID=UPI00142FCF07|nr:hypothetical protein [Mariprofundus ferrooxydans]
MKKTVLFMMFALLLPSFAIAECVSSSISKEALSEKMNKQGKASDTPMLYQLALEKMIVFDRAAAADLNSVITREEAYYTEKSKYISCNNSLECNRILNASILNGVEVKVTTIGNGYVVVAKHLNGGGVFITTSWDIGNGQYCVE